MTGASGFVGEHVAAALTERGHNVAAMTRRPDTYKGPGVAIRGDVNDEASLRSALEGQAVAYYMVHSLAGKDFVDTDRTGAQTTRRNVIAGAGAGTAGRVISQPSAVAVQGSGRS